MAKHSCPKRQVGKEQQQSNPQPCSCKHVKEHTPTKLTFWQALFLWPHIERAAQIVGWNATNIVNYLSKSQPKLFGRLHQQVIE
jgi:hypothetical protein